jgi:hypothetical protein
MVPFKKLLHQGTIAELAVMDEINKGRAFAQVYQDVPYDYMNATIDVGRYDPHDIHIFCAHLTSDGFSYREQKICTVEVKSAMNGGRYDTFFAEIRQTTSNGYSAYLVHPPTWIVYVDIPTRTHYWYDGAFFVNAVKSSYKHRYQPKNLKAEGVRFAIKSEAWGYIGCYRQRDEWDEICERYDNTIKTRINTKKRPLVYKQCLFLPDLEG